CLQGYISPFTF
nr:immunoglobulin light chain junction region [Macaca mulatta]MOW11290.1 immunoglobulin light chain junction region [Macaca mulatta]MOW11395.1 immunoglobulin light chain junction region [Macaca mulatta]MOW13105.1 immunoglobulin light chain junction region [Macaca mulatta]MOW14130.1 immunoglobulin light chain junction region [Macaca mulatta]